MLKLSVSGKRTEKRKSTDIYSGKHGGEKKHRGTTNQRQVKRSNAHKKGEVRVGKKWNQSVVGKEVDETAEWETSGQKGEMGRNSRRDVEARHELVSFYGAEVMSPLCHSCFGIRSLYLLDPSGCSACGTIIDRPVPVSHKHPGVTFHKYQFIYWAAVWQVHTAPVPEFEQMKQRKMGVRFKNIYMYTVGARYHQNKQRQVCDLRGWAHKQVLSVWGRTGEVIRQVRTAVGVSQAVVPSHTLLQVSYKPCWACYCPFTCDTHSFTWHCMDEALTALIECFCVAKPHLLEYLSLLFTFGL